MRIAIIADPLDNQRAGVHVYTRNLVNALIKYDDKNEYILIREKVDPALKIRQVAVPNIHLPIGFASLRLFFLIPLVARRLKVDAVFEPAHFGPFNLPKRIKRITMIHDLTPILFSSFHRYHSQLLQKIFLKRILKKSDLVLSNSNNTTADLKKVYPFTANKTSTIHLGKEPLFHPTESKEFLELHNINDPYFCYVGTIEPRKNLVLLLEAYQDFRENTKDKIQLILVGQKGWKSEDFYEKLEQHPYRQDILLAGFIEKRFLPEVYSHSLALIYPSIYEGFGLPVVEAMACGTNVICPSNSSLTEVGGEVAFYFENDDREALQAHMQQVHEGGAAILQRRQDALEWSRQFSWERYVEHWGEVLKGL